jgi:predicted PurR-regulated permease PerM
MEKKEITFDRFIRGLLTVLLVIGGLWLLNRLSSVLLPFFIAWIIAYLLYPAVCFFQYKLHLKYRIVAILCTLLVIGGILTAAFMLFIPPMVEEFGRLRDLLGLYIQQQGNGTGIPETVNRFFARYVDMDWIYQNIFSEEHLQEMLKEALPQVWNLISGSINLLVNFFASFITLLYLIFILLDYEEIASGWLQLLPIRTRRVVKRISNDVKEGMNRYFRGQALIAFTVGVLFSIGFLLIDFPLAIGFGLFIGALNMVPYLQLIALVPTVLLALLKAADTGGNFWWILAGALLVFVIVQAIQDTLLTPRIMGKVTGLHPAIILLSLSIWGSLLGILGMIIALPLTTLLLTYYQRMLRFWQMKRGRKKG